MSKAITQDDLNRALARQKREHAAELEQLRGQLTAVTTLAEAAKTRVAELEGSLATAQAQRVELEQRHAEASAARQRASAESQLTRALTAAQAVPSALSDVLRAFQADTVVEQGDDGAITAVTVGGKRFDDVGDAAREFIEARPHFRLPYQGGAGTPRGFTPPPPAPQPDRFKMKPADLGAAGWNQKPGSTT